MIMGWGRRRRRSYGGRDCGNFKGRVEDGLRSRIERQMFSRAYQLNPLKINPTHIYEALHTREELDAYATLNYRFKRSLEKVSTLRIDFEDQYRFGISAYGQRYTGMGISIGLPMEMPGVDCYEVKDSPYKFKTLPEGMREELMRWAKAFVAYDIQSTVVTEKLGRLFEVCNTMGHVLRVWPTIAGFLPEEGRAKLLDKKAQSPYPSAVVKSEYDDEGTLISRTLEEEWTPAALKPYELLISEALVMAELPRDIRSHIHAGEYVHVGPKT